MADDAPARKRRALELLQARKALPIWSARKALCALLAECDTVVLVGETGSGKTTQAPQLALQRLGLPGAIACTQPRRVAAVTVAARVAQEQGTVLGDTVGYAVRFDVRASVATRLVYMTDGMLIREAISDPLLARYSLVFVDEAHERSIGTDVLLGLLKRAQASRRGGRHPLKLAVMSATLEHSGFVDFFEGAEAAFIEGRQHAVEVFYTRAPLESYQRAVVTAVLQVCALTLCCLNARQARMLHVALLRIACNFAPSAYQAQLLANVSGSIYKASRRLLRYSCCTPLARFESQA
jgi:HrpA-like RNA helicase